MAFYINEFFVYFLESMLTAAFVFRFFQDYQQFDKSIKRAVDIAALVDNSSVGKTDQYADIHFVSMKIYLFYGKHSVEIGK